ncbi:MAG: hypothetical protein JWM41_3833 [Gemmatimonadetes bacterium]|nr:hypothetical protein [Gemmatimonadota bacterium]
MRARFLLLLLPSALPAQSVLGTRDSLARRVDQVYRAFDRTVIEFSRTGTGRVSGFVLESGRVRGLKFVRGTP